MKSNLILYFKLTKFVAVLMIIFVTVASYCIASESPVDLFKLLFLILGVGLSSAGSLALNQYAEIQTDALMHRTKNRPLPSHQLTPFKARAFGNLIMFSGYALLWVYVNPLCAMATMACGFSYLYLYTPMKSMSSISTLSGSIPGALLPIMGWLATYNSIFEFDTLEAPNTIMLLTVILYIWQIPHSLIISIRYIEDYRRAGMKQLPIVSGIGAAERHILFNFILLFCVSLFPVAYEIVNPELYLLLSLLMHTILIAVFIKYKKVKTEKSLIDLHRSLLIYLIAFVILLFSFR